MADDLHALPAALTAAAIAAYGELIREEGPGELVSAFLRELALYVGAESALVLSSRELAGAGGRVSGGDGTDGIDGAESHRIVVWPENAPAPPASLELPAEGSWWRHQHASALLLVHIDEDGGESPPCLLALGGAREPGEREQAGLQLARRVIGDLLRCVREREAAREREDRFRVVVEQMPMLVDALDEHGRVCFWNSECERVYGYSASEILGRGDLLELIYPEPEPRTHELMKQWMSSWPAHPPGALWRGTAKDGSERVVAWTNISDRHPVPGWASWGVGVDVTERERLAAELRASSDALQALIDAAPIAILKVDTQGRVEIWNRAAEEMFGWRADEVTGRESPYFPPGDPVQQLAEHRDRLRRGERIINETVRRRRRDGVELVCRLGAAPLRAETDEVSGWIVLIEDVTAVAQAEAHLRESEERYRLLVEDTPAIHYIYSASAESTIYASSQVERVVGFTPQEWTRPGVWVRQLHDDDRERAVTAFMTGLESGEHVQLEYRIRTKDGRVVWMRDEATPLRDERGELFARGIAIDITERKRLEEERVAAAEELRAQELLSLIEKSGAAPGELLLDVAVARSTVRRVETTLARLNEALLRRDDYPEGELESLRGNDR